MYLLSEHAILVKMVLSESMLENVLFYRIPLIFFKFFCSDFYFILGKYQMYIRVNDL